MGSTHRIGDSGRAVGQVGIVVGKGGGAFRPGDLQRMAEVVTCDLPALIVRAFDVNRLPQSIAFNGPAGAVRAGLSSYWLVVDDMSKFE
ncbi:hypothetical protein GCM10009022_13530 [Vreelandella titanicae]